MAAVTTPLILRITQPTFLKRRPLPAETLVANEKVPKGPCRIPLQSYAYSVPGENLQNHFKVAFTSPYMGSSVWYVYRGHCQIESANQQPGTKPIKDPLILRITQSTFLKRRPLAAEELATNEKIAKNPCRIFLQSYAYNVPGEDLRGHLKVCFEGPILGNSSVWYVYRDHCTIEGADPPQSSSQSSGPTGKINQAGLDLIKEFEGLRLDAYICPAGVPTIGYGTTKGVKLGDRITTVQAEALLKRDLENFEAAVRSLVKVPLNSNQFSALVSFAYNVGVGALQQSTLLKRLNQGDYQGAAQEFLRWNKAGGQALPGLTRRRQVERSLFLRKP
jgi:GH24 family phage-related lysozyme (muramidase)